MDIAKFNRPARITKGVPVRALDHTPRDVEDEFDTSPFDDFGGHGLGLQDTEIAPGLHAEFGCYTTRLSRPRS